MRRHKNWTLLTTGAVAAAIAMLVWLGIDGAKPVTAAMIFESFKEALARSVWIKIEGIDLGNVEVSGRVNLRRGEDPQVWEDDTLYSELHVLLKADNSDWNDLDGVVVTCQTPEQQWQYIRGSGGMGGAGKRVIPTEDLYMGSHWQDYLEDPLGHFGAVPLRLTFSWWASQVVYAFPDEQREYLRSLMRLLLAFSGEQDAERLVSHLETTAREVQIEKGNGADWVLTARGFGPLAEARPAGAVGDEWPNVRVNLHFDPVSSEIRWWESRPDGTLDPDRGRALDRWLGETLEDGQKTFEQLVAAFEAQAETVEVEKPSASKWILRAEGVQAPVTEADRVHWGTTELPELVSNLVLTIHYDAAAQVVASAEFSNVASETGRIHLEMNDEQIDPEILSPEGWKTPFTRVYGE